MVKRAVITGASGTIGRELWRALETEGIQVYPWNRQQVSITSLDAMESFLERTRPDVVYHLAVASRPTGMPNEDWQVNCQWASDLAWLTFQMGVRFVFTSSVMVFSARAKGPFTLESEPDAMEGYGFQKRVAEQKVLYQNPEAIVVRLGWQIGRLPGGNTMVQFLHQRMQQFGRVEVSKTFYPACAFLEDTVQVLKNIWKLPAGLYMVDSNRKWSFYQIARQLNRQFGEPWKLLPTNHLVQDQRMIDPRIAIPPLSHRLRGLK